MKQHLTLDEIQALINSLEHIGTDHRNGLHIVQDIAYTLQKAREKHPEDEWSTLSPIGAIDALINEASEVLEEIKQGNKTRMKAELLDVIAVAIRFYNTEYMEV